MAAENKPAATTAMTHKYAKPPNRARQFRSKGAMTSPIP